MSNIDRQALGWVVRQAEAGLTQAERAEFDAWYALDARHRGAYLRARAIEHALAQAASGREMPAEPVALPARRTWFHYGGLAAALALSAGIAAFSFRAESVEIVAAKGELRAVRLADRSLAVLNGDSVIAVQIGARERRVEIRRGEAWFEVARDPSRAFVVEAGQARVRAVGTAFGVRRTAGAAEVMVTEGVVEAWSDAGTGGTRRVAAGERAQVTAGSIPVVRDPDGIERALAWRSRTLVFANQSLEQAVADFNRYSSKQIVVADPALLKKTLVGRYRIDQPELFAQDMGVVLGVPVQVTAQGIVIGAMANGK